MSTNLYIRYYSCLTNGFFFGKRCVISIARAREKKAGVTVYGGSKRVPRQRRKRSMDQDDENLVRAVVGRRKTRVRVKRKRERERAGGRYVGGCRKKERKEEK